MIFTFSFDDGAKSWVEAARILSHYNIHGTFNVVLRNVVHKRVKTRPKMFPDANVLTWSELKYIESLGHEIASHGTRHVDLPMCSAAELWLEVRASKTVFDERGFKVDNYACAFNTWDKDIRDYALRYYKVFRVGVGVNQHPPDGNVYHAMDGTKALEYVKANPGKPEWIVGLWHNVDPVKFEETVRRFKSLGVPSLSVREIYGGKDKNPSAETLSSKT